MHLNRDCVRKQNHSKFMGHCIHKTLKCTMHKIYAKAISTEFCQFYVLNKFMSSFLVSSLQKTKTKSVTGAQTSV